MIRSGILAALIVSGCAGGTPNVAADSSADDANDAPVETSIDSIAADSNDAAADDGARVPKCPPGPFYIVVYEPGGVVDEFRHFCVADYSSTDIPMTYWMGAMTTHVACSKHDGAAVRRVDMETDIFGAPDERRFFINLPDGRTFTNYARPDMVVRFLDIEPVGGAVEGDFEGDLTGRSATEPSVAEIMHVSGRFRLCHGPASGVPLH